MTLNGQKVLNAPGVSVPRSLVRATTTHDDIVKMTECTSKLITYNNVKVATKTHSGVSGEKTIKGLGKV